tara:strand:+ start:31366 stop:32208 length:843 start_codon:yes stop_codon:yes gene_type:complete
MLSKKKILIFGLGYITHSFIKYYRKKYTFYLISSHVKKSSDFYHLVTIDNLNKYNFDHIIFGSSATSFKEVTESKLFEFLNYSKKLLYNLPKKDLSKIIYLSSSAIYGFSSKPFDENSDRQCSSMYQIEKNQIESLLLDSNEFREQATIFRISNPYGSIGGINSLNGLINVIFNNYKNGKNTIINSRKSIRDFIHITDVISCMDYALGDKFIPGVYNLGSGESSSLESVIKVFSNIYESDNFLFKNLDKTVSILEIKKLKKVFKNFSPISLKEGLKNFYV